jgi:cob(I)alamin adenosyltransferase
MRTTRLEKGYVHLYTGNGKGKTTAALGLALRAAGAGLKVYIAQFAKGAVTSELKSLKRFSKQITVRQSGARTFIKRKPAAADRTLAGKGLSAVQKAVRFGGYDVVIFDEVCVACRYNLIAVKSIVDLIKRRPEHVEIILTGRYAPEEFVKMADIVTEMKEVKHYFIKGVTARKGIEF